MAMSSCSTRWKKALDLGCFDVGAVRLLLERAKLQPRKVAETVEIRGLRSYDRPLPIFWHCGEQDDVFAMRNPVRWRANSSTIRDAVVRRAPTHRSALLAVVLSNDSAAAPLWMASRVEPP
jgi:hypothetical protein